MSGFAEDFKPRVKESVEFWEMISPINKNAEGLQFFILIRI